MKKFLLFALVAAATLNASAIGRVKKASFLKDQKKALVCQNAHAGILSNRAAAQAIHAQAPKKNVKFGKKIDESPTELTPAFSTYTYRYSEWVGGEMPQIMYEDASFLVDEENKKVYLQPFDIPGVVVGTISDEENDYSEDGGLLVTFDCSNVFAQYSDEEGDHKLYLLPSDLDGNPQEGYAPVPTEETTFKAYYFPEDDELYMPYASGVLAVYLEGETTVWDEYYVVHVLDLKPQEVFYEGMSKAVVTGKSYYTDEEYDYDFVNEDALVLPYFDETYTAQTLFVKGADGMVPYAWVEIDLSEEGDKYILPSDLYLAVSPSMGLLSTVGLIYEDDKWNYNMIEGEYGPEYPTYFSWTDNADETASLKTDFNTAYGEYLYAGEKSMGFNYYDLDINILWEPVEVGVTSVKGNAPQNNVRYNLAGQRVDKNYKGVVIENGKKFIKK